MVVHYKFKSSVEEHSIDFTGPHITLNDLKKQIIEERKINKGRDFFELELTHAQSGLVYTDNALIGRNTAVLVRRVPVHHREPIQSARGSETDIYQPPPAKAAAPTDTAASTRLEGGIERERVACGGEAQA